MTRKATNTAPITGTSAIAAAGAKTLSSVRLSRGGVMTLNRPVRLLVPDEALPSGEKSKLAAGVRWLWCHSYRAWVTGISWQDLQALMSAAHEPRVAAHITGVTQSRRAPSAKQEGRRFAALSQFSQCHCEPPGLAFGAPKGKLREAISDTRGLLRLASLRGA